MSALDQILPARAPVASPFTGEVIDRDDPKALAAALAEIEAYLDELYGKHRQVYRARDEIKARLGEISPTDLPARRSQTEKQAKIDRCPRCRTRLPQVQIIEDGEVASGHGAQGEPATGATAPALHGRSETAGQVVEGLRRPHETPAGTTSEPEPSPEPEARVGADPVRGADNLDVAGPASSGSEQSELLPQGQRTAEQDAALGVDIFGAKLEGSEPLPQAAQEAPSSDAPAGEEEARGGASSSLTAIVVQAGEIVIPQGKRAGRTVADVAERDPDWCLWYLEAGKTETLKAAITTYLYATRPDLMKEGK